VTGIEASRWFKSTRNLWTSFDARPFLSECPERYVKRYFCKKGVESLGRPQREVSPAGGKRQRRRDRNCRWSPFIDKRASPSLLYLPTCLRALWLEHHHRHHHLACISLCSPVHEPMRHSPPKDAGRQHAQPRTFCDGGPQGCHKREPNGRRAGQHRRWDGCFLTYQVK
jgi:hypothetical protein